MRFCVAHSSNNEPEQYSPEPHTEGPRKGLLGSLHGVGLDNQVEAFIVTNEYRDSPIGAIQQFDKEDWLDGNGDRGSMRKLFARNRFPDEKVEIASNELATRSNIMNVRPRLANSNVVFIQGHTQFISSDVDPAVDGQCTQYMTQDFHMHDPPQGLTCDDLCEMFYPWNSEPTRRLVLTDTCYSYNFNELQYCLDIDSRSSPDWIEFPDWDETFSRPEGDILMHFAAGSPDQQAHESNGGFFTNGFCKAMEIPRTLPDLLKTVRSDVENSMCNPHLRGKLQVPQIYSSYDFDLDDMNVMKAFGFFRELASHT